MKEDDIGALHAVKPNQDKVKHNIGLDEAYEKLKVLAKERKKSRRKIQTVKKLKMFLVRN